MTPQQSLEVLYKVTAEVPMIRGVHIKVEEAFIVLQKLIQEPACSPSSAPTVSPAPGQPTAQ